jgi:predicted secreted protein
MSLPIALGVYFIIWWLSFFILLPIGVRTDHDERAAELGHADSAPVAPHPILSVIIFAIVYTVIAYRLIPLDRIPMSL